MTGAYEASWVRIDNDSPNVGDRVINWGSVTIAIDASPGNISDFSIGDVSMVFNNKDGYFNVESDTQSKWYPNTTYLNRRFTKFKIEAGYYDTDDTEQGVVSIFEGLIDSVIIGDDQLATVSVLAYNSIFTKYLVTDLAFTGAKTVSQVVDTITNQAKITGFIPYVASAPDNNFTIDDSSTLSGTYWEVILQMAFLSNSMVKLNTTTFSFAPRVVAGSSVYDFIGQGAGEDVDIFSVNSFDDEGADKVRLYWKDTTGATQSVSVNATALLKYFNEPVEVDLTLVRAADRQATLDALLGQWETPRPYIEFTTKFLVNIVDVLNRITIYIQGKLSPTEGTGYWDAFAWDDGTVWGELIGAINISNGDDWMVTSISKDLDSWTCTIRAEKVV